jgi:hypothetical protein
MDPDQRDALAELEQCHGLVDSKILGAFADWAHEKTALPLDHPPPDIMAHKCGFKVVPIPGLCRAYYDHAVRTIFYPPRASCRREAWALYHELAEAIMKGSGLHHNHRDVQALTVLLMVGAAHASRLVLHMGEDAAASHLCRRQRHAPAWCVRYAVMIVVGMAQETAA